MAPSLPTQAAPVQAMPAESSQPAAPQVELTMAPTAPLPTIAEPATRVETVHVPAIQVAAQTKSPDWSTRLVSEARSIAATTLEESARNTSYEVVLAKSNDGTLVRLAPNLYELRLAPRVATSGVAAPRVAAVAPERDGTPAPLASVDGLEVSNGVGLPRLASRTARQLSRFGADVARVSDWRNFAQRRTEVHYRAGHLAGAKAIRDRLPVDARLVPASRMHAGVNVRLVVGRDMVAAPVAQWYGATEIARAAPQDGWRHL